MAWRSTWNRSPEREGFFVDRGGMFPPGVKLILILTVGVFLLEAACQALKLPPIPFVYGALSTWDLIHGQVWRLITYMFLHGGTTHLLVNMFILWMLGAHLERQLGTRPLLTLYFTAGVLGGLCEAAFNAVMFGLYGDERFLLLPTVGASAGVMGVLMAFACLNPRAEFLIMFIVPMEAWLAALFYALYETWPIIKDIAYGPSPVRPDNVAHAAHFGGMVLGFFWIKWGSLVDRLRAVRPEFKVVRDVAPPTDEEEDEEDRILQKIHDEGLDSLTPREKMFLQEMTRRRQGRM
jgi:membrane associated rhomboid family serine protease